MTFEFMGGMLSLYVWHALTRQRVSMFESDTHTRLAPDLSANRHQC